MSRTALQTIIENAISKADDSYFFENYTKQAAAVLKAVEAAGYAITPGELPDTIWAEIAREMRTGRLKPEEHVKDVFTAALRVIKSQ